MCGKIARYPDSGASLPALQSVNVGHTTRIHAAPRPVTSSDRQAATDADGALAGADRWPEVARMPTRRQRSPGRGAALNRSDNG